MYRRDTVELTFPRLACGLQVGSGRLLIAAIALTWSCSSPTAPTPPTGGPAPPPGGFSLSCPAPPTGSSTGAPVVVAYPTPVATGGVAPVTVTCTPASGSPFPIGQTGVTCRATDARGQFASCTFNIAVNLIPQLTSTRFLAFGDSFTAGEVALPTGGTTREGWPSFSLAVVASMSYPTLLTSTLQTRYTAQTSLIAVINEGKPGEWAEDGVRRLPTVIRAVNPEVLLLFEGINDLSAQGSAGVNKALVAIDTMAREGRSRGARVFIANLPPTRADGRGAVSMQLITALNNGIRTIASGDAAVLVDLYAAMSTDVPRYIGIDGLHPTEFGYRRIADTFAEAIRANLEVR